MPLGGNIIGLHLLAFSFEMPLVPGQSLLPTAVHIIFCVLGQFPPLPGSGKFHKETIRYLVENVQNSVQRDWKIGFVLQIISCFTTTKNCCSSINLKNYVDIFRIPVTSDQTHKAICIIKSPNKT